MDEGESVQGSAVAAEVDLAMGRAALDSEAGAVDSGWAEDVRLGR